jgi:sulfatase maturation enzyme AslB (radical SAM superfamily)
MDQAPIEHSQCLLFSSFAGAVYLFDAATLSVHPWPWPMTRSQLDLLYSASDESLVTAIGGLGAPAELSDYILSWRHQAGAFGGWESLSHCPIHGAANEDAVPKNPLDPPPWRPVPGILSNLLLIVTDACNLRCTYCIFSGNYDEFHTYRPARMSWDTARRAVDHFLALNEAPPFRAMPDRKLDIVFFGGEPLLESELMRQVVAYARARERDHYWIYFSATTNLTVLPDELAHFCVENGIGLDVSLDGPEPVHDLYRRDAAGRGSFAAVRRNLEKLHRIDPLDPPSWLCRLDP